VIAVRPEPIYGSPPQGCRWVAVPDKAWRVDSGRQCRMIGGHPRIRCAEPAVAAMNRGRRVYGRGVSDSWWAYCADHMFGRWVEDGRVMHWIAEEVSS
jgi:hypothetical protein